MFFDLPPIMDITWRRPHPQHFACSRRHALGVDEASFESKSGVCIGRG